MFDVQDDKLNKKIRILVLATDCDSTRIVYHYLKDYFIIEKVIIENKISRIQLIKRRVKKLGFLTVLGQLLFQTIVAKWLFFSSKKRIKEIIKKYNLNVSPIDEKLISRVNTINDDSVVHVVNETDPDIILVNGTRIISKWVLNSTGKNFINTHLGITPLYRGVHGGYWALANNDKENFGSTIHMVDQGIDTGRILYHAKTLPGKSDNYITYPYLQIAISLPFIKQSIEQIIGGNYSVNNQSANKSKLWSHPTIAQYFYNRWIKGIK